MTTPSTILSLAIAGLLLGALSAAGAERQTQTVERTFNVGASPQLVVDNLEGSIEVTGYSGDEIQVVIQERYAGPSDRGIDRARSEVKLDMSQDGDTVRLYLDGPFRRKSGGINFPGWDKLGYSVRHDFEVRVPFGTSVWLQTVNGGDIVVRDTRGPVDAQNTNGSIDLAGVTGSNRVHTTNGDVRIEFADNPSTDSTFTTTNGNLEVGFAPGLDADIEVKMLNGRFESDYEYEKLAASRRSDRRELDHHRNAHGRDDATHRHGVDHDHHGHESNDSGRRYSLQVGSGGPELFFETVNGNVVLSQTRR